MKNREGRDCKPELDEFTRRYWIEQEERAETGTPLRLAPEWRQLPEVKQHRPDGPQPFAA